MLRPAWSLLSPSCAAGGGVANEAASSSKKDKGAKGAKGGDQVAAAEPQLPPLPTVEDVGDIDVRSAMVPLEARPCWVVLCVVC